MKKTKREKGEITMLINHQNKQNNQNSVKTEELEKRQEILEDFAGGRIITEETLEIFDKNAQPIKNTLYRGYQLPINILKPGLILEEWNGSSHWSINFQIARNFSRDIEGINDAYAEEIANELNISENEARNLFVPVILKMNGVSKGIRLYELLSELPFKTVFEKEKEITTLGINTTVVHVEKVRDGYGIYYLLEVEEI